VTRDGLADADVPLPESILNEDSTRQHLALVLSLVDGWLTAADLADLTGLSPRTVRRWGRQLAEDGPVVRRPDPPDPYRHVYAVPDSTADTDTEHLSSDRTPTRWGHQMQRDDEDRHVTRG